MDEYQKDKEQTRRKNAIVTPFSLLWKKIQEKRADKALRILVASSAVAAVAGAGLVGVDRYNALQGRLAAVERRATVDLTPVRRESAALAKKVEGLSRETAALTKALEAIPPAKTPPAGPTKAQVTGLANKIRSTSLELNGLAGQIKATAEATRGTDRVLAGQLSTLATDVSTLTNDLSGRITAVEGGADALASEVKAGSKQLSGLRSSLGVVQTTLGAVSTRVTGIETSLKELSVKVAAVDAKADRAISGLPLGIAITQLRVADGGAEVRPVGSLDGGEYIIEWSVQDGYGCNGDPISFQADGKTIASWQLSYGKCDRQTFTQRFELPEGGHDVAVGVGCGPQGNGDCVVDVLAVVTRVGG